MFKSAGPQILQKIFNGAFAKSLVPSARSFRGRLSLAALADAFQN
jgi:hypothetical protein